MSFENDPDDINPFRIRLAVTKPDETTPATIIVISKNPDGSATMAVSEDDPRIGVISSIASEIAAQSVPQDASPEQVFELKVNSFATLLHSRKFQVDRLPESDVSLRFEFDARSGTIVGQHEASHAHVTPNENISRNLMSIIENVFRNIAQKVSTEIIDLVREGDHEGAARVATDPERAARIIISQSDDILSALNSIDRTFFDINLRINLLKVIATLASNQNNHIIAGSAAEELLDIDPSLDEITKSSLTNVTAIAAKHRGETEYAVALWRQLLRTPANLEAGERGWVWRNLSMALQRDDPEALQAAKHSVDAFLEAGDKREAAKSLSLQSRLQERLEPQLAMQNMDDILSIMSREGIMDEEIRASILHAKGRKLLEVRNGPGAFQAASEAIEIRRKLLGVEPYLISSLHLAAIASTMTGDLGRATALKTEATEIEDRTKSDHFLRGRRVQALLEGFNADEARILLAEADEQDNDEIIAGTGVAVAISDPRLTALQKLGRLEGVLRKLEERNSSLGVRQPVYLAIAQTLRDQGNLDRALNWYRRAYEESPLDITNRDLLVSCLWQDKRWGEAAIFLEQQLGRAGEMPGLLFAYGRSLFEAGDLSGAVTALGKATRLGDTNTERQAAVRALRDQALDAGGTIVPERQPEKPSGAVSLAEVEEALAEFSSFIAGVKRMTFWNKPSPSDDYEWISNPESFGQTLLHTFIQAKFGIRVEVYEEVDTGAGRLDVLLRFNGGLSVLIELKMCGFRYTSTYAASGEGQIRHYMDNRHIHIGFLVVFDARLVDYGNTLIETADTGRYTIREILVDVRPRPPSNKRSAKTTSPTT